MPPRAEFKLNTQSGAHGALSAGNFRVSADAAKLLASIAKTHGLARAGGVVAGARASAASGGYKTVMAKHVEAAMAACPKH